MEALYYVPSMKSFISAPILTIHYTLAYIHGETRLYSSSCSLQPRHSSLEEPQTDGVCNCAASPQRTPMSLAVHEASACKRVAPRSEVFPYRHRLGLPELRSSALFPCPLQCPESVRLPAANRNVCLSRLGGYSRVQWRCSSETEFCTCKN